MTDINTNTELEAAAFRRLVKHLQDRTDVQNIDMMNLTGFCRNCLARWYHEAATQAGQTLNPQDAKKQIYGMDYDAWKQKYQTQAEPEKLAKRHDTHS